MLHLKQKNVIGFTFIELIIVILVAVILVASISILWTGSSVNLDAQASLLINDIRYTQNLAMVKGERYRFVRSSATSYQVTDNNGVPVTLPFGGNTVTFGSGIFFGTIANLPNNFIVFDSLGIPYIDAGNPGTKLSTVATINLVTSNKTRVISISPETGRVL